MKYKVTLNDGIELLITADKEVDAVRQAKDIKDSIARGVAVKDFDSREAVEAAKYLWTVERGEVARRLYSEWESAYVKQNNIKSREEFTAAVKRDGLAGFVAEWKKVKQQIQKEAEKLIAEGDKRVDEIVSQTKRG
jgi:hypothetical protein|nr:MAG TPA: hypothetical protein [Caudoviricetes sp.]